MAKTKRTNSITFYKSSFDDQDRIDYYQNFNSDEILKINIVNDGVNNKFSLDEEQLTELKTFLESIST